MANPIQALCSLQVYPDGQGDPLVVDHGFSGFDVIGIARPYHGYSGGWSNSPPRKFHASHDSEGEFLGVCSQDARGKPLGQFIGRFGLKCRAYMNLKDTRLSDWTTASLGGNYASSWDERRPLDGLGRVYRLFQYDASVGVTWSAQSKFQLPAGANFAIGIIEHETPSDWDPTALIPYYMIEFGGGAYAIYVEKNGGAHFLRKNTNTGKYEPVHTCAAPRKLGDEDEAFIWIECGLRGRILMSSDFGEKWEEIGTDEDPFYVPAGAIRISGQGSKFGFGIHQLNYFPFQYDAPYWSTLQPYTGIGLYPPVANGIYEIPANSGVTFTDISNPLFLRAQYRATLTPGSIQVPLAPWPVIYTPLLKTVNFRYLPIRQFTGNTTSTPFDPFIMAVDISYPNKLGDGNAKIRIMQKPQAMTLLASENWRYRKMIVKLGYLYDDGSTQWFQAFTGYLDTYNTVWDEEFGQSFTEITLQNAAFRFKTTKWSPLDIAPLSTIWNGQPTTPNAACDYVGFTEGLTDSLRIDRTYMNWHPVGDTIPMQLGSPERPFELIREDETKWETIARIQSHAGCEAGANNAGGLFSLPINYTPPPGPVWTFRATSQNATDIRQKIAKFSEMFDSKETVTTIFSIGQLPNDQWIMAMAVDQVAETSIPLGRFSRWRTLLLDKVKDPIQPAVLAARVQMLAARNFGNRRTPELETVVNPNLGRWQRVACQGLANVGMPDGTEFMILSLNHSYRYRGSLSTMRTSANIWRLT